MELLKAITPEKDSGFSEDSNYFNSPDFSRVSIKKNDINAIKFNRDQEKQTLYNLNQQFMNYIDKVKYLELTNISLLKELKDLRSDWGKNTRTICEFYDPKLLDTRAKIDDIYIKKLKDEINLRRHEQLLAEAKYKHDEALVILSMDKNKIINLENQLNENDSILVLNKNKVIDIENDIIKYKNEISILKKDLDNLLIDLEKETLSRIKLENEKQTLEEQIPFLKAIHEKMINEMQFLQSTNSQTDPKIFYSNELDRAIREIRKEFENLNKQQKKDMEEWYIFKTQEILYQSAKRDEMDSLTRAESTSSLTSSLDQLKNNLSEGQRELINLKQENANLIMKLNQLEDILDKIRQQNSLTLDKKDEEIGEIKQNLKNLLNDHDELMNNKAVLEFEINTYHRLLGSEEKRNMVNKKKCDIIDQIKMPKEITKLTQEIKKINEKNFDKLNQNDSTLNNIVTNDESFVNQTSTIQSSGILVQEQTLLQVQQDVDYLIKQNLAVKLETISNETAVDNIKEKTEDKITAQKIPGGDYRIISSETKSKTTFQRSAKGPISICECSPDGKLIIVENTSKNKDISLANWEILRRVDSKNEIRFKFPVDLTIRPNKIVRIWSNCVSSTEVLPTDLINFNIDNWGIGEYVITVLLNELGNEKATHLQKTVFNQVGA